MSLRYRVQTAFEISASNPTPRTSNPASCSSLTLSPSLGQVCDMPVLARETLKTHAWINALLRRSSGYAGYFLPLIIDRGRELIHPFEEHRNLPNIFLFQRGGKARHSSETNAMLYCPERR